MLIIKIADLFEFLFGLGYPKFRPRLDSSKMGQKTGRNCELVKKKFFNFFYFNHNEIWVGVFLFDRVAKMLFTRLQTT